MMYIRGVYQSQVDFTTRKKAMLITVKWALKGTGMDYLLPDNGMSESQCEKFSASGHKCRNRRFLLQYATVSVIKI